MKLTIVTPIYKRPDIFSIYCTNILHIISRSDIDIQVVIIGSEGIESFNRTPSQFHYIEWFNVPLAMKWQQGLNYAKETDTDYVMILGSDDIFDINLFREMEKAMRERFDYIGLTDRYFYEFNDRTLTFWDGYKGVLKGRFAGSGRILSRKLLDKIDWKPWYLGKNTGLDKMLSEKIKPFIEKKKGISCLDCDGVMVGIKTYENLNKYVNYQDKAEMPSVSLLERFNLPGTGKFKGKVLNITVNDWANFAYTNSLALRAVGVDCKCLKLQPHRFKYPLEGEVTTLEKIFEEMIGVDLVQVFFGDVVFLDMVKTLGKRCFVYHAGSNYRSAPEYYNGIWNPIAEKTPLCLGEFQGLGAKTEDYLIWSTDIQTEFTECERPLKIGHYPPSAQVKGTQKIVEMMNEVKGDFVFDYSVENVTWAENLNRLAQCDIIIELFQPELNGKPYGSFGITALEAASMGKIVVTQQMQRGLYAKTYGENPLFCVKDEKDFIKTLNNLLSLPSKELQKLQKKTNAWFVENHGLRATGERLKKIL